MLSGILETFAPEQEEIGLTPQAIPDVIVLANLKISFTQTELGVLKVTNLTESRG